MVPDRCQYEIHQHPKRFVPRMGAEPPALGEGQALHSGSTLQDLRRYHLPRTTRDSFLGRLPD